MSQKRAKACSTDNLSPYIAQYLAYFYTFNQ